MPIDWSEALDLERALVNCHLDILGDWYRDPWGWPEIDWVVESKPEMAIDRLNGRGVRRSARIDVAKENFAVRPAVVLDPVDRLIYQALVDRLSADLIGHLRSWVHGWRLRRSSPARGHYSPNDSEWDRFRQRLSRLAAEFDSALLTDIVSYFASIPIERITESILSKKNNEVSKRLADMLHSWDQMTGRSGLPQRSMASAVLANLYLSPLDDVLAYYGSLPRRDAEPERVATARWMDDIWLFGGDLGLLRKAQVDLQATMRDLGLNMNLAKTDVVWGEELERRATNLEHSAVDGALIRLGSPAPLNERLDTILARPEFAPRTTIKFVTLRMRQHEIFDRVDEIVDVAARMPHGADALARLFRDSGAWRDLEGWYVWYQESPWGAIDWSVSQFGTMFPSSDGGGGAVQGRLAEVLIQDPSLAVLSLCAQRLAAWDPDDARFAIRDAAERADHPLERRALALAALNAGEERALARGLLTEFEENAVTLEMMEARNFTAVNPKLDYEGG
jgi:hypothetical protein